MDFKPGDKVRRTTDLREYPLDGSVVTIEDVSVAAHSRSRKAATRISSVRAVLRQPSKA